MLYVVVPCQVVELSLPFSFGTAEQSIEAVGTAMGQRGSHTLVIRHGQKMIRGEVRRGLHIMLTVDAAGRVRPRGRGRLHPVLRARGLSLGPLRKKDSFEKFDHFHFITWKWIISHLKFDHYHMKMDHFSLEVRPFLLEILPLLLEIFIVCTYRRGRLDGVLHLVQALDPEWAGRMKERWQELLGHVDFTSVGKLQHGRGLLPASVFQDNDGMLARGRLNDIYSISI